MTIRDLGYCPGQLPTGPKNSILDVKGKHSVSLYKPLAKALIGVRVGQVTVGKDGEPVRKGVTVILPRNPNEIHIPCYAGMHTLNGNGEVSGSYQVKDWGYTNTVRSPFAKLTLPQIHFG
jgi:D-aminopeptidase